MHSIAAHPARSKIQDKFERRISQKLRLPDPIAEDLWRKGFGGDKAKLYDFARFGHESFLSDLQRELTQLINGRYASVLNDKLIFEAVFGQTFPTSTALGIVERGRWVPLSDSPTALWDRDVTVFVKPVAGGGGKNVFKADIRRGDVSVGGRALSAEAFVAELVQAGGIYLFTERVEQHSLLADFFPGSVNTVRLLTMRDPDSAQPFLAQAVMRVGTSKTGGVDNFSQGGLSFSIDATNGHIGFGRRKLDGLSDRFERHPETGVTITGQVIPHWDEVLQLALGALTHFPPLQYAGWDVIVSPTGPVLLEGNNYSDVHLLQVHGPLLTNPAVLAFYKAWGILDCQRDIRSGDSQAGGYLESVK